MNKGVIMAVMAITLWGVAIAPTKWALESFHPFTLMFVRLLLAGLIFLPYAWIKWRKERVLYTIPWMRVSLLSFTGVAGYFMLTSYGIALTSGTHASIIDATLPLFTLVFSALYLKENITREQWIGLVIGMLGVLLISIPSHAEKTPSSVTGDLLILLSAALFAVYTIQMKRPKGEAGLPSELFTALTLLIGAGIVLPFAALEIGYHGLPDQLDSQALWSVAFLVIGASTLAYWLWNRALLVIPAATGGIYLNILPVVSVLTSIVLLRESVTWKIAMGAGLVVAGIWWVEKEKFQRFRKQSAQL